MKQVLAAIVLAIAIGILREKLATPLRIMHLQMQPPDAKLLMPVEGISVVIADNHNSAALTHHFCYR